MNFNDKSLEEQGEIAQKSADRAMEFNKECENQKIEVKLPTGFFFLNNSVMYQPPGKESQKDPPTPIFICSGLNVVACTRDKDHEHHGRLLEFKDLDGQLHHWAMPMELLGGDGSECRRELLSKGLIIAPGIQPRQLLTNYIQLSNPSLRVRCVGQVGWYNGNFILPDETIGKTQDEKIILQTTSCNLQSYAVAGHLEEWKVNLAAYCTGNSRLLFAVSSAFAPPLLDLIGHESGGFHFRGASSTGKTTALNVAASVWGGKDYPQKWRATANGIEAVAAWYNDAFLPLDEIGQMDPVQAGEVAYMLANGIGKARADRFGFMRKRQVWRLIFLSTGEINLSEHMRQAGVRARAGQEVRIIDIPADTGIHGIFEDLHGYPTGAAFADMMIKNSCRYHGIAAREFLRYLVRNEDRAINDIKATYQRFIIDHSPKESSGQVQRMISQFALVAAAGELATAFGITGWQKNEAFDAALSCFQQMVSARGGTSPMEEKTALAQIRRFFEQHAESRFTDWFANSSENTNTPRTYNRSGFRKTLSGETEYYVFVEAFRQDICNGLDHNYVEKILVKNGWLIAESSGRATRSERLPGTTKKTRCYRFSERVLCNEEE